MAIPWTFKGYARLDRCVRKRREEGAWDKEDHTLLLQPSPLDHTRVANWAQRDRIEKPPLGLFNTPCNL